MVSKNTDPQIMHFYMSLIPSQQHWTKTNSALVSSWTSKRHLTPFHMTSYLKNWKKLGITGTALNWFASYLSNRTQKVEVNSTLSDNKELNISVFQGTCLGPILFLASLMIYLVPQTHYTLCWRHYWLGLQLWPSFTHHSCPKRTQ